MVKVIYGQSLKQKLHNMKVSAGIVFRCKDRVLLAHSTNAPWNTWMPPKGHVERGENTEVAAIRETEEEIGVRVTPSLVKTQNSIIVDYDNKRGEITKRVVLYIVDLKTTNFPDNPGIEVVGGLQTEEVDAIEWMTAEQIEVRAQIRYRKPLKTILL